MNICPEGILFLVGSVDILESVMLGTIYVYAFICIYIFICMYIYIYIHINIYNIYDIFLYIFMYIFMCIYICAEGILSPVGYVDI
jgi:hypothetical protein